MCFIRPRTVLYTFLLYCHAHRPRLENAITPAARVGRYFLGLSRSPVLHRKSQRPNAPKGILSRFWIQVAVSEVDLPLR
jgi:hypothetical protein